MASDDPRYSTEPDDPQAYTTANDLLYTRFAGLYDLVVDFNTPMEILSFTHVPSRDYNGDTIVNFEDFALLASLWHEPADPQVHPATSVDLNGDAHIDPLDVALFSEFWLQRTDCNEPETEPAPPFGWIGGG